MRPKVPRGTKASKALPIANSKVSGDKSFAAEVAPHHTVLLQTFDKVENPTLYALPPTVDHLKDSRCVRLFAFTLDKAVFRLETRAGSSSAWSMAFNLMDRCHPIRPLEVEMMLSTRSFRRRALANTCHVA